MYDNYLAIKNGEQQRSWKTEVVVYWGPPGTGKTRRAQFEAGSNAYWLRKPISKNGALWFDGYEGQEVVVIDEFYGWIARDFMQRMCDRYPLMVEIKGSAVHFLSKKVIITSNQDPKDWWKIGLGAMERRIEHMEYMGDVLNCWKPPAPRALPLDPELGLLCDEILGPDEDYHIEESPMKKAERLMDVRVPGHVPLTMFMDRDWEEHSDYSNDEYVKDVYEPVFKKAKMQ